MKPVPFQVDIAEARLQRIGEQLASARWPAAPADDGGWRYGADLRFLRQLLEHWRTRYDWRAAERAINALPQYTASVGEQRLHFVHLRGGGLPLLLTHGWPGSFHEFHRVAPALAAAGFDVVVPSLPGFAFSGAPPRPVGLRHVAGLWHRLMTEELGYTRYGVHGGDMGSAVSTWLAVQHPEHVAGLHLNLCTMAAADQAAPQTDEERAWLQALQQVQMRDMGYAALQASQPQLLALALADNPLGCAAWLLQKFQAWSDCAGDLNTLWTNDELITFVMLYLASDALPTSLWMYRGAVEEASGVLPPGARVTVPTALARFPKEFLPHAPRSRIERTFTSVARWTEFERGGHFPALEQPQALAGDLAAFFEGR